MRWGDGMPVPRIVDDAVAISRVHDVLNRWAPLTVVQGLQGAGKTTQVVLWLRELSSRPSLAWIDAGEGPSVDDVIAQLPQRRADGRAVVVIDDADRLAAGDVERLLTLLRRHHDVHAIAISRAPTSLDREADGRVQVERVTAGDLMLRPDEIADLASRVRAPLSVHECDRLARKLGGWAAPTRMVLDAHQDADGEPPLTRAERYVQEAVLQSPAGPGEQQVLMELALADCLTHRLIRDVLAERAQGAIEALEAEAYTHVRYHADDVELRIPHVVRRVLRRELMDRQPDAACRMHERLAAWFERNHGPGYELHALRHAHAAQAWTLLESVWSRSGAHLMTRWPVEVERVLRDVPIALLTRRPSIAVLRDALAAGRSELTAIRAEYVRMSSQVAPSNILSMPPEDMLIVGTGRMMGLRQRGLVSEAAAWAERLEVTMERAPEARGPGADVVSWFYLQRAVIALLQEELGNALRWLQRAWHDGGGDAGTAASIAGGLALVSALNGWTEESLAWQARSPAIAGSGQETEVLSRAAAQVVAADRLQAAGAEPPDLSEALGEYGPLVVYAATRWTLTFGPRGRVIGLLDRIRQVRASGAPALLARAEAEVLIAAGRAHQALRLIESTDREVRPLLDVPLAWIHLLSGDPATAGQVALAATFADDSVVSDRVETMLVAAIAIEQCGDQAAAADAFDQAVAMAVASGIWRPFTLPDRRLVENCMRGLGRELPPEGKVRVSDVVPTYPEQVAVVTLTPRERQLVALLPHEVSRERMADSMFVSINTIKKQLATLYRKLGVTNRADALTRLAALGMLAAGSGEARTRRPRTDVPTARVRTSHART